jgi:hypothetical protein
MDLCADGNLTRVALGACTHKSGSTSRIFVKQKCALLIPLDFANANAELLCLRAVIAFSAWGNFPFFILRPCL